MHSDYAKLRDKIKNLKNSKMLFKKSAYFFYYVEEENNLKKLT